MRCFTLRSSAYICGLSLLAQAGCSGKVRVGTEPPEEAKPPVAQADPDPAPEEPADAKTLIESTVLIATPWGHGTGVVVRKEGWILTNYHVISSGKNEDFGYEATVTTAELQDDGSMAIDQKLDAVVYKVDPKRDLALLKITDPPGSFSTISLADKGPLPGSSVAAIGNAGVGFGWAIKHCTVNAIGTFENFATAIFQMQREDDRSEEEQEKAKEELEKASKEKGKQVQTDCNVLPGDSGGPLVDEASGKLVALNASIRPSTAGFATLGAVAFHVHIDEINDFLQEIPERPKANLPDPWEVAGKIGRFIDYDEDGEVDTLRFEGMCDGMMYCYSALTDIDQSTFRKKKKVPKVEDIYESRKFNSELASVRVARPPRDLKKGLPVSDLLIFANTDGKGGYDKLVVLDGETYSTRGYDVDGEFVTRDPELDDFELQKLGTLYETKRLSTLATKFSSSITGGRPDPKNPDKTRALEASFRDATGDGKLDTLQTRTRLDTRVLVDLDQDQFGKVQKRVTKQAEKQASKSGDAEADAGQIADKKLLKKLRRGKVHGEFLAVMGSPVRVFYDTDHDGKYDLLLEGDSLERGLAFSASSLDGEGRRTPANEHLGRRLLRPSLIQNPELAQRLDVVFEKTFRSQPRATLDDGHSSFPEFDPKRIVAVNEVPDLKKAAVSTLDREAITLLMDLDKNSFKKKSVAKKALVDAVRDGNYDAEFVFRTSGTLAWAYYDANNDGRFERVFVSRPADPRHVGAAFTFDKKGNVTSDPSMVGKDMFQAELFKSKSHRKTFSAVQAKTVDSSRF